MSAPSCARPPATRPTGQSGDPLAGRNRPALLRRQLARAADDEAAVKALAVSIAENGLLSPITVRPLQVSRGGRMVDGFEIVAGHHRVKAFRRLGRETIPAFVVELDALRAELALIDENLCRNDLTPAERAAATARRKHIYVWLHPETKHGGDRKSDQVAEYGDLLCERFTAATADATGHSERNAADATRTAARRSATTPCASCARRSTRATSSTRWPSSRPKRARR